MKNNTMKLSEIAKEINVYLRRFEKDPIINNPLDTTGKKYFSAGALRSGKYVYVTYISFQGQSYLTRNQAMQYLEWLRAGNVGKHYEALSRK